MTHPETGNSHPDTLDPVLSRRSLLILVLSTAASACAPRIIRRESREPVPPIHEPHYTIEFDVNSDNSPEIPKAINLMVFFVVHDGEVKTIILDSDNLANNPQVKINGFVIDMLVVGKNSGQIKLSDANRSLFGMTSTMTFDWHGMFSHYTDFKSMSSRTTPAISPKELKTLIWRSNRGLHRFTGTDFKNTDDIPSWGKGLVNDEARKEFQISQDGDSYSMVIEQKTAQKFTQIGNVTYLYKGNNPQRVLDLPNAHTKLQTIHDAIAETYADFGFEMKQVIIVDTVGENASAHEGYITFTWGILKETEPEELKIIAEHELLHRVSEKASFDKSTKLRSFFTDIKGYEMDSPRRKRVMEKGWDGTDFIGNIFGDTFFFEFLNESNFLFGGKREMGHSYGNIYELNTSFLHSLMYLDRLEANLEQTMIIPYGEEDEDGSISIKRQKRQLTHSEKITILNHYVQMLEIMIEEVAGSEIDETKMKRFLRKKLAFIQQIKARLDLETQSNERIKH